MGNRKEGEGKEKEVDNVHLPELLLFVLKTSFFQCSNQKNIDDDDGGGDVFSEHPLCTMHHVLS